MNIDTIPVVAIVVICYIVGLIVKSIDKIDDKWIPCIVGIVGAVIGVAAWATISGFPADNWLTAIEIGIASGLASTGVNQIYKQMSN